MNALKGSIFVVLGFSVPSIVKVYIYDSHNPQASQVFRGLWTDPKKRTKVGLTWYLVTSSQNYYPENCCSTTAHLIGTVLFWTYRLKSSFAP